MLQPIFNKILRVIEIQNSLFVHDGIEYNSSSVGVVCRLTCIPKFKHGIIS